MMMNNNNNNNNKIIIMTRWWSFQKKYASLAPSELINIKLSILLIVVPLIGCRHRHNGIDWNLGEYEYKNDEFEEDGQPVSGQPGNSKELVPSFWLCGICMQTYLFRNTKIRGDV